MSELFEATVPAVKPDNLPMDMRGDPLVRLAIEKDFDADKLEKIIELFNRQEDRRIREDFETTFAAMRSELPVIRKTTQGHTNNYASLETIQKACADTIRKYGFSYRWREEAIQGGKRIILTISRKGYSIENSFDVPMLAGNNAMNPVQVAGAMTSYGHRYTFTAGFGLIIEGEDTDGNFTLAEVQTAQPFIDKIKSAQTREQLQSAYTAAMQQNQDSKPVQKLIIAAKDEQRAALHV